MGPAEDGEEDGATPSSGLPWEGSDRDYTYEELLGKLFYCICIIHIVTK